MEAEIDELTVILEIMFKKNSCWFCTREFRNIFVHQCMKLKVNSVAFQPLHGHQSNKSLLVHTRKRKTTLECHLKLDSLTSMQPLPHLNQAKTSLFAFKTFCYFILCSFFFCFAKQIQAQNQQSFTISGTITDASTGETLIGATVYEVNQGRGTSANIYGFYSLSLPSDTLELVYSFVGYQAVKFKFVLSKDERKDVALTPGSLLEEAEIIGNQEERIEESTQMGSITLDMSKVDALPVLLGQRDLMKTLHLIPKNGGKQCLSDRIRNAPLRTLSISTATNGHVLCFKESR